MDVMDKNETTEQGNVEQEQSRTDKALLGLISSLSFTPTFILPFLKFCSKCSKFCSKCNLIFISARRQDGKRHAFVHVYLSVRVSVCS